MVIFIVQFVIGIGILLASTHYFIRFSERFAAFVRLSPLIIGLTLVSVGTSLPELAVSLVAQNRSDSGLALGNIIGSNIVNIFLIFGIGIIAGKIRVGTTKTQLNMYILVSVTIMFLLSYALHLHHPFVALLLFGATILTTLLEYSWGISGRTHEDSGALKRQKKSRFAAGEIAAICGILPGVVAGGILTVNSVEALSTYFGLSTTVLGLSLTAIATSLPELLTTLFSEHDHQDKITIGNIMGSNIYNLALIGGILYAYPAAFTINGYETIMLSLATLVLSIIIVMFKGKIIPKTLGFILLSLFAVYIYFLR